MAISVKGIFSGMGSKLLRSVRLPERWRRLQWIVWLFLVYLLIVAVLGIYWSVEPKSFDVREFSTAKSEKLITGTTTTGTLLHMGETLLNKPGGYLSNDKFPPGVWVDNMPNWEFGVLVQIRDMSKAIRQNFSRSQSISAANKHIEFSEPKFHSDNDRWLLPSSESEYNKAIEGLRRYHDELADKGNSDSNFYARADNLEEWLQTVESRLGSLSQRLGASVGQKRINLDSSSESTAQATEKTTKTPWLHLDDNLYEARGTAWALVHLLKAVEIDFARVLDKKMPPLALGKLFVS